MIYKEKIGTTFLASFFVWSALTVAFLVLSIAMANIWLAVSTATFLLAYIYFIPTLKTKTFYELDDDCLFIKSGKYELKIPYSNITEVSQIKSMLMMPTTSSFNRLEIKYTNQKGKTDFVHISPINKNEFITLLESKIGN